MSNNSDTERRAMSLARLALHYPKPDLSANEYRLVREDMLNDLAHCHPGLLSQACDRWRQGRHAFFPTSGELIAVLEEMREESIVRGRGQDVYVPPLLPGSERKFPKELRGWREIVGDRQPPMSPVLAAALDRMQGVEPQPLPVSRPVAGPLYGPPQPVSQALRDLVREHAES